MGETIMGGSLGDDCLFKVDNEAVDFDFGETIRPDWECRGMFFDGGVFPRNCCCCC